MDFFKFAYVFKCSGINILPKESNSTSVAPDKNNLANALVSCFAIDSPASISAKGAQNFEGKINKQLSSPLVSIAPSPSSFLNFEGIANRLFASKLCLYSPISIAYYQQN